MKSRKILLKFHQGLDQETGQNRIEAYFRPQTITSEKRIKIETIYVPDPDWHDMELGRVYLCQTRKLIYSQDSGPSRIRVISVRVAKEVPQLLESEMTSLVLRFVTGKDRRSQQLRNRIRVGKKIKKCHSLSNGIPTLFVVDQRDPLQPNDRETCYCKPIKRVHQSDDGNFQIIQVKILYRMNKRAMET